MAKKIDVKEYVIDVKEYVRLVCDAESETEIEEILLDLMDEVWYDAQTRNWEKSKQKKPRK